MKKNGYLRKFIAMFLVFVMLMADSSMTTFASSFTVGRVKQQNADEDNGIDLQSGENGKLAAGKYTNFTLTYNQTKNAFTTDEKYAKYYNTNSPLGVAGSFHIVAFDTARLTTHTNGNILAKNLYAGSNFGTSTYPDELSYVINYEQVQVDSASSENHVLVIGSGNTLSLTNNNNNLAINGTQITKPGNIIVDEDSSQKPFISLADVRNEINKKSTSFAKVSNTAITANFSDQNNRSLTLTDPDYAGYYNMTAAELNTLSGNPLKMMGFESGHDGSIIVNVDCSGVSEVNMPQKACVYIDGNEQNTGETVNFANGKVIWNFVNATNKVINAYQMTGMIIANGATVNLKSNVNGTVVADNVNVLAESHRTDFTGVTTPAEVEADGTKTVDGKEPTSTQKFNFELAESTVAFDNENEALNSTSDKWKVSETVQNNGSKINFNNLHYGTDTDIGTHWYKVSEKSDVNNTSYIYDNTVYLMKVVVTKTNNVFNADKTYYKVENNQASSTDKIQFNNTTVQQKGNLKIVKAAGTDTDLDEKTFYFKVTDSNGNIVKNSGSDVWSIKYDKTKSENSITIKDLTPGKYTVVEKDQNGNAVTTGTSFPYTVSGDENVIVENGNTATVTVTNTKYEATGSVSFRGSKLVNEAEPTDDQKAALNGNVSFELYKKEKGDAAKVGDATLGADGTFAFDTQAFTLADAGKTYEYQIKESAVNAAGYGIDSTVYTYYVTVTDNGDGTLGVTVTDKDGKAVSGNEVSVSFNNTYSAAGSVSFGGSKLVNSKALTDEQKAALNGKVSFELYKKEKDAEGEATKAGDATLGADGTFAFDAQAFTLADAGKTYEYQIKESAVSAAGYGIDKTVYTYYVAVTDNGDGTLAAAVTDKDGNKVDGNVSVSFNNTYTAAGSTNLTATKNLTGREFKKGDNWTFTVTAEPAGAPMPERISLTTTATSGSANILDFGTINYTLKDAEQTYVYTITESGNVSGVINDAISTRTVSITAHDNGDGTLRFDKVIQKNGNTVDNAEFINTYETTSVSGTKSWSDGDNQDGIRPNKITINLLADGVKVNSQEVTPDANGNWTYSFTDLQKYKEKGQLIDYTVEEEPVTGYNVTTTKTVNGYDILNTHTPETISINGTKHWDDNNNQDGKRPEQITVNLLADGTLYASQTVAAASNWTYNFTDLPKYKAGKEIKYKVEEVAVTDYTTEVDGYDIYNTHTPETTSISGTKTWDDADDQDGKRPDSIKVNLLANGEVVQTKTVTEKDNWSYTFDNLPVYEEGKVGQKLTYTISEESVKDYTTVVKDNNIINSYTPGKVGVSVTKIWDDAGNQDGIRPEKITVKLLADGQDTGKTATLSVDNNWTQSITGLDEKKDGKAIKYTWAEENVPKGYELTGNTTSGTVTTLTNKHVPEVTAITGTKTWNDNDDQDGKRPTSITVNLLADGNVYDSKTVTATTNWTYTFDNLPVYANGQKVTYTVSEDEVAGYETAIDGFNITNSYTPETTSVSGQKVWNDANNQDGKRPNSIKVRLLANGTEVATKDVTAADNWAYNFTDLPKYANGEEIVYTVTEDTVADYTTAINGTTITNSYTPGKTSITVTKAWVDNDNQDGIRPENIKVQLYAGEDAQGEEVTLGETNNWTYTWTGLDAKKDGQDIVYTVKEVGEVTGYTSQISGDAQTGYVITNTHTTETTSVEGKKVWDDANNQDGKRPDSIKVRLLANGTEVATKDVTAADNWTYSFTDLPKFANGEKIVYTVTEDKVADYTTVIDGTTITNRYKPGKTSITVTKAWADNDNQDGIRPESVKVQLYAGETAQGEEVTLSVDNNWTYTWSELDAKKDGQDIVYTVRETEVPAGYEATVTGTAAEGFILTNTHETEVISVEGTKTWNDNNQTAKRPESITVRLLADGKEAGSQKVTADSNWTYKFTELPKYAAGKEIVYTVSEDAVPGYITSVNGNNLINTITSVKVSKVDITDHKELAGAHIQILDKDGNIIDEWDSTWEAHEVTGLKTNEQYTLRETVAPDGYTVTSDTTFTLKEDGTVDKDNTQTTVSDDGTLLVEDSKTSVKVSKVDIADGKELEGAHIQVIDEDENIVAEWDSTKEPHVIEGLKTDKKYILRETVAPTGYELTNDTTFVLKADGTVDTEKTTTVSKDGVLLVQDKLATGQSIAVTKKLTTITGDLRAMDQTFYVALYSDEACTQRVSDVKAIEFKNASSSTVVFNENIEVNKDYYIAECSQDGTAQSMGALADGTMYEAKFNNGNKATVKEANGTTTVYFDNVFSSIPDGYYKQGKLTITKKLLGADGNAKKSNNVFYAGIFDDADYTQLSTQVSQNIVKLDLAGGSEVSQVIKIGLDVNKTVTLYVTETDSNGKPVAGTSGFAYKVSVDGSTVTIDEANENASVTITNTENPTTTTTTTEEKEESNGGSSASSHSMSSSTKAPKTGDDTPIAMYVIILIAAAALIVFGFEKRRRSNRK